MGTLTYGQDITLTFSLKNGATLVIYPRGEIELGGRPLSEHPIALGTFVLRFAAEWAKGQSTLEMEGPSVG
jgi:hypothetical protein